MDITLVGQTLAGRYRIDAFIGRGGMADVYKVWGQQRAVFLALKVLHADLAKDKVFLRRFKREAQTLAKLQHPNIVRFDSLEQDGSLVFMLMDYVEGTSLRKEIFEAKDPLSIARVLEIVRSVCSVLQYAHSQGFLYSHLKPANILIDQSGRVMLSDLGVFQTS